MSPALPPGEPPGGEQVAVRHLREEIRTVSGQSSCGQVRWNLSCFCLHAGKRWEISLKILKIFCLFSWHSTWHLAVTLAEAMNRRVSVGQNEDEDNSPEVQRKNSTLAKWVRPSLRLNLKHYPLLTSSVYHQVYLIRS